VVILQLIRAEILTSEGTCILGLDQPPSGDLGESWCYHGAHDLCVGAISFRFLPYQLSSVG
jgi:hypothetical protein